MRFVEELKKRGVVRTAVLYVGAAFAILQGVELLVDALHLPAIVLTAAAIASVIGLPVALVVSWALDIGPDSQASPRQREGWLSWRTVVAGAALLVAGVLLGMAPQFFAATEPVAVAEPVRRYEIRLPEEAPVDFVGSSPLRTPVRAFAITPDGERLIYSGPAGDGVSKLFVRRLDDFDVEAVQGTEGAYRPFVSPNGRLVAFFAHDELRVVPIDGGPVRRIIAAPNPRGGAWLGNDRILYKDREGTQTWIIAIDGGNRQPVRVREPGNPDGSPIHLIETMYPTPNNRGLLVIAFPGNERSPALIVWDPDSGAVNEVIQMPVFAQAVNGGLVYAYGNDLLAVDYDVESMRATGEPRRVGTDLRRDGPLPQFVLSEKTLIYATGAPYRQVQVARITPEWRLESTAIAPGQYRDLAVAPDGGRVAATLASGSSDIWVYSLADGQGRRLTRGGANHHPMWSDDGDTIYFLHENSDDPVGMYYTSSSSATFEKELAYETPNHADEVHSGDLAMMVVTEGDEFDYALVNLRTRETTMVSDQEGVHETLGNLSPDRRWVALTTDASGRYEVIVKPVDSSTSPVQVSVNGGEEPRWSADMREIYYRYGTKLFSARVYTEEGALMVSTPAVVFEDSQWINVGGYSYWPDPANGGFLILRADDPPTTRSLRVVEGWQSIRPETARSGATH
ncbi:MAG: hypothetical protein R3176_05380 [Woeseiaceae bacterium]|nr:hypothetical protein [Woeseiaceae bacterium]